jgi:hypothetical protein
MSKKQKVRKTPVRRKAWSKMHVRSLLYKHYKARYKGWQDTKEDAEDVIQSLKSQGYKRASKKLVLGVVKVKRLQEIKIKKATPRETLLYYFEKHKYLLDPFPFFEAQQFCYSWETVNHKLWVGSRIVWSTGSIYQGGKVIPYNETFQDMVNSIEKLQALPRRSGESYEEDWFFRLDIEKSIWDEDLQGYIIPVITCDAGGKKAYYFGETPDEVSPIKTKEPEEIIPEEVEEEVEGEIPEAPKPPEVPEKKPTAPSELTSEQRVEIEKEKVRVEAEQKAKTEIKIKTLESAERLLKEKVISFDQYMELVSKLI